MANDSNNKKNGWVFGFWLTYKLYFIKDEFKKLDTVNLHIMLLKLARVRTYLPFK